jgi:hypothetical protein
LYEKQVVLEQGNPFVKYKQYQLANFAKSDWVFIQPDMGVRDRKITGTRAARSLPTMT